MCKMVFRIKATLNYAWTCDYNIQHVIDEVLQNQTLHRMLFISKQMLCNVFEGSSPKEPVLGEVYPKVNIRRMRQSSSNKNKSN